MGVAFVTGMQGDDPTYFRVVATPKHYAVHSGPEPLRHGFNVDVSPHDLSDTYVPAFRDAITEAHAQSVMCAYNAVDGLPACASPMLLQEHLRKAWGFEGYVTSDCAAVADIATGHKVAPDFAHASAARREGRHRPRVRVRQERGVHGPGRGREAEPAQRGGGRHRRQAALHGPVPPGHVRPARLLRVRTPAHERGELARAPPAVAAGRAREPGAAEEQRACCRSGTRSARSPWSGRPPSSSRPCRATTTGRRRSRCSPSRASSSGSRRPPASSTPRARPSSRASRSPSRTPRSGRRTARKA